jgi:GR25 family glycosyltransferase involved in LPS biosynthesis
MNIDTLYDAPAFIVSIDRCLDRYDYAYNNVQSAGFKDIKRFKGVDAKVDDLNKAWSIHGSPKFNTTHIDSNDFIYHFKGKQGCMLSHLNLWKHIIDNKIAIASVFEDDVLFHSQWHIYASEYYKHTPNDFHILYLGSQIEAQVQSAIAIVPVYCTHAYVITYEGAKLLYNLLLNQPNGVYTIDYMLIDIMWKVMYNQINKPFIWYVWNGNQLEESYKTKDPSKQKRNGGIVFQDDKFESEIKVYEFGKS